MKYARLASLPIVLALPVAALTAAKPTIPQTLRGATEIVLHQGANRVAAFAGDKRTALVVMGWRDNGNAHGYSLYTILMPAAESPKPWNVVGVDHDAGFEDTIRDDPHTGEDVVSTVRFVRRRGRPRSPVLLVIATRHWKDSIPDPAPTTIQIFTLHHSDGTPGATYDYFALARTMQSRARYCDADMALKQEAGLPLPAGYGGAANKTGCE